METLVQHLKNRHVNFELHRPVLDDENDVATFYLWSVTGVLCGYQQYRRFGEKKPNNDPKQGKYFTYKNQSTLAVWGTESLWLTPNLVFLTEGVFDACRLTERGYSALAVLSNDPGGELKNWLRFLNRKVVAVCDNDFAGKKLAKFGDVVESTLDKDLGDSTDEVVTNLLQKYT